MSRLVKLIPTQLSNSVANYKTKFAAISTGDNQHVTVGWAFVNATTPAYWRQVNPTIASIAAPRAECHVIISTVSIQLDPASIMHKYK